MSHADVCPCKHGRAVCSGACFDCCAEHYGVPAARSIVKRDGLAPLGCEVSAGWVTVRPVGTCEPVCRIPNAEDAPHPCHCEWHHCCDECTDTCVCYPGDDK